MINTFTPPYFLTSLLLAATALLGCQSSEPVQSPIDRHALVTRHNVLVKEADSLASLSVGNGEFAFTVDVSGLQTFPEYYENGIPLGTQSQWGWHHFPNTENYTLEDVAETYTSCEKEEVPYAVQHSEGRKGEATQWLRTNPHRLHLGLVGLVLLKENGEEVSIQDLQNIEQKLDIWTGNIESRYTIEGVPVVVELYGHQEQDLISFRIESPLIEGERLRLRFRFPYGADCHVCPGYAWNQPEKHQTEIANQSPQEVFLQRSLDSTTYSVGINWQQSGTFVQKEAHHFELTPAQDNDSFTCSIRFSQQEQPADIPDFETTHQHSEQQWQAFWENGGAIDFSACTDPRANELERRVVLSQYLTKIQCAGSMPPQETGLTLNSWYGKFHLEMHWWHGTHFALWNRAHLLEKSMDWYTTVMDKAKATAAWQGYEGARWQKMTGPAGNESPSNVGAFLVWQQPHPIYFAELLYRQDSSRATLEKYKDRVFQTADFMASFAQYDENDGKYHLCPPLIPAQELFRPLNTKDPPFELAYWHFGLSTAQTWRKRLDLPVNEKWQAVIDSLAPLPVMDNLYLPNALAPDAYSNHDNRRDHPVVVGSYGFLPLSPKIDTTIMVNTFNEIMQEWQWETTWGWDYPLLAMTAARLGMGEAAIDALFMDVQKNTYLVNGHNYQDKRLRIYLPGNGGLLTAVAMMAAGWDHGPNRENPGFPNDGQWAVRWEGIQPMP